MTETAPRARRVRNTTVALSTHTPSKTVKVLGIDPALRNFGLVLADVDPFTGAVVGTPQLKLVVTKKGQGGKTVRVSSDDLSRCRTLYEGFTDWVNEADVVCAEMPIGSQSAVSMKGVGACIALLATIQKPLIQLSPEQVKVAALDDKNATKEQMIAWAHEQHPDAQWLRRTKQPDSPLTNSNEHLADGLGVIHAGVRTDEFKLLAVGFQR